MPRVKQTRPNKGIGSQSRLAANRAPVTSMKRNKGISEKAKLTTCEVTEATGKIALGTKTFRMMGPFTTTLSSENFREDHGEDHHGQERIQDGPGESEHRSLVAEFDIPDDELTEQLPVTKERQEGAGGGVRRLIEPRVGRVAVSGCRPRHR